MLTVLLRIGDDRGFDYRRFCLAGSTGSAFEVLMVCRRLFAIRRVILQISGGRPKYGPRLNDVS